MRSGRSPCNGRRTNTWLAEDQRPELAALLHCAFLPCGSEIGDLHQDEHAHARFSLAEYGIIGNRTQPNRSRKDWPSSAARQDSTCAPAGLQALQEMMALVVPRCGRLALERSPAFAAAHAVQVPADALQLDVPPGIGAFAECLASSPRGTSACPGRQCCCWWPGSRGCSGKIGAFNFGEPEAALLLGCTR